MLPEKCVKCGVKDIKIKKRGLCQSCYSLWYKHNQYLFLGEKIVKRSHLPLKDIKKLQEILEKKKPSRLDILQERLNKKHGIGLFNSLIEIAKSGEGNITHLAKQYGVTKQAVSELLNKYFYTK
jgi:predicted Zn-ribbon and HTH transcriptional regulator